MLSFLTQCIARLTGTTVVFKQLDLESSAAAAAHRPVQDVFTTAREVLDKRKRELDAESADLKKGKAWVARKVETVRAVCDENARLLELLQTKSAAEDILAGEVGRLKERVRELEEDAGGAGEMGTAKEERLGREVVALGQRVMGLREELEERDEWIAVTVGKVQQARGRLGEMERRCLEMRKENERLVGMVVGRAMGGDWTPPLTPRCSDESIGMTGSREMLLIMEPDEDEMVKTSQSGEDEPFVVVKKPGEKRRKSVTFAPF